MPSVVLTKRAENDLDLIHEYYQELLGTEASFRIISAILKTFDQLEQFPGSGRPSVVPDIRELVLTQYPFIAPYRLIHGRIQVIRVLHQRAERPQDW
ncbi:type II toxin-antitoxin system RelE/ParE family toxin [Pseudomonas sp. NPDC098747]|uniref:type II toxin-antitoxin system RelE/ParE family toxin n=1 Tax=Pseudomonas sp. NPDC098747 TaxID=3364487 RepID=UPI00383A80D8